MIIILSFLAAAILYIAFCKTTKHHFITNWQYWGYYIPCCLLFGMIIGYFFK